MGLIGVVAETVEDGNNFVRDQCSVLPDTRLVIILNPEDGMGLEYDVLILTERASRNQFKLQLFNHLKAWVR